MLRLHGFIISNYYNMVQHALMAKGIEFGEVNIRPSQEPEFLQRSPMGKVPVLETPRGFLAETDAILDYLEESHPQPPLFPADPFERARAREIMKMTELYVELPARRHLAHVLFGAELSQTAFDQVRPEVEKGLRALQRILVLKPYATGSQFTYADIFLLYSFNLANLLMQRVYQWDIVAEVPGLANALELTRGSAPGQKIAAARERAMAAMGR